MKQEAIKAGFYQPKAFPDQKYARIQILTVDDLFEGKKVGYPKYLTDDFARAKRQLKDWRPSQKRLV